MSDRKSEKIKAIIHEAAAQFFELESNRTSLLTVTWVETADRGKKAIIYITVFPEDKETEALEFAKRKRTELHEFLIKNTGLSLVPFVDVVIDTGEKNRQQLDKLRLIA